MTATASSYSSADSGKSLARLLKDGATYPRISAYLDGLSAADRLEQMLSIKGFSVGKLYRAVSDGPAIGLDDFLPEGTKDGEMVIFEGRNSLPAFSRFQKRFVRRGEDIVGYNHQVVAPITGPGFFVLAPSDDFRPKEVLFDYTQKPPFFPEMYPPFKPNDVGLSRLVYANMKDYCRKVAKNVVVGAAFKHGKAQHAYFSLTLPLVFEGLRPSPRLQSQIGAPVLAWGLRPQAGRAAGANLFSRRALASDPVSSASHGGDTNVVLRLARSSVE